jgi:glycine/D-amino acid oxidase-like deaminating enzyme
LAATNALVEQAQRHSNNNNNDDVNKNKNNVVVLRDELYRVATDDRQRQTLQQTAVQFPAMAKWLEPVELRTVLDSTSSPTQQSDDDEDIMDAPTTAAAVLNDWDAIQGALRLSNGCQVIHVPSYLQGLWRACEDLADHSSSTVQWTLADGLFDTASAVAAAAAAGDDNDKNVTTTTTTTIFCVGATSCKALEAQFGLSLPVQLVRGHSVEVRGHVPHAMLSGKYISPTTDQNVTLIGATHDFHIHQERTVDDIIRELQDRTAHMCTWNIDEAHPIHRITSGVRVQSSRGPLGRRPIVGRIGAAGSNNSSSSSWIFTGLSSRGLLYHGIYGEKLARAIWADNEDELLQDCPDTLWWKTR